MLQIQIKTQKSQRKALQLIGSDTGCWWKIQRWEIRDGFFYPHNESDRKRAQFLLSKSRDEWDQICCWAGHNGKETMRRKTPSLRKFIAPQREQMRFNYLYNNFPPFTMIDSIRWNWIIGVTIHPKLSMKDTTKSQQNKKEPSTHCGSSSTWY